MKQFEVDYDIKKVFEKNERKKHPLWIKRRKVRIALLLMPILITIIIYFSLNLEEAMSDIPEWIPLMRANIAICIGMLSLMPWALYFPISIYNVLHEFRNRNNENIFISDESIRYIFHIKKYDEQYMQEDRIDFKDIKSIIYNKYHERVEVYGRVQDIWYSDYFKKKIGKRKNYSKPGSKVRFHLYFNDNKEILKMIEERSPVEIETVNVPNYDE